LLEENGMRYFRKNDQEYLANGDSLLRVGTLQQLEPEMRNGRIVRVMDVLQVMRETPTNPITRGQRLAISFPEQQANSLFYIWSPGEECQVKLRLAKRKKRR
jgi:hypothetical protein